MSRSSFDEGTPSVKPEPFLHPGVMYLKSDLEAAFTAGDETWIQWEDAFWHIVQKDVPENERRELVPPGRGDTMVWSDDIIAVRLLRPDSFPPPQKRYEREPPRYHITAKQKKRKKKPKA